MKTVLLWRNAIKQHGLSILSLLGLVSLLAHVVLQAARSRGLYPGVVGFFENADQLLKTGTIGSAFYPPLTTWIVTIIKALHIPLHPAVFNACWLLLGTLLVYTTLFTLTRYRVVAWIGTWFVLLNPYFIWTAMLSNDTGPEWVWLLCVVLGILLVWKKQDVHLRSATWVIAIGAFASVLTRVTGLFIIGAILLSAWFFVGRTVRHRLIPGAISLFIGVMVLCTWNLFQVGSFTPSTNGGINLYFGNHPAYLQGHPQYDIDGFLGEVSQQDVDSRASEVEQDRLYRVKGRQFILNDLTAFIYRGLVKSEWYWVGFEKIPHYSVPVVLRSDTQTVHLLPLSFQQPLFYMLYRIACLGFIAWALLRRAPAVFPHWLIWSGWVGLWPIMVLTFPDTRFRLPLETLMAMGVVCFVYGFWQQRRGLLQ
mgnify:FL=1